MLETFAGVVMQECYLVKLTFFLPLMVTRPQSPWQSLFFVLRHLPLALARALQHQGLVTSFLSSTLETRLSWLLAMWWWEVLKTYRLSANTVSTLLSTCCSDALHFILSVKMSLNL